MTIGQAATRLRTDQSNVGKYIRVGLSLGFTRLRLRAGRKRNPTTGRLRYDISVRQVRQFALIRKRYGV